MSYYSSPQYQALKDFWNEPDYFEDIMSGFVVVARRNHSKAWCGYVGVPEAHALFGKDYDHRIAVPDRHAVAIGKTSPITAFLEGMHDDDGMVSLSCLLNVHGGLTFAKSGYPKDDGLWYFGFDCSHYNDLTPQQVFQSFEGGIWGPLSAPYRNLDYVKQELATMAAQMRTIT
jgi:hypothetical protein